MEAKAREILSSDEVLGRELGWREGAVQETKQRLENELTRLDRKANENANAESELLGMRIRGKTTDEAYDRQQGLLLAEKTWISEERARIQEKLADLQQKSVSLVRLEQLRQRIAGKILSNSFADRRFVLEALQTKVIVTEEGAIEVEFTIGGGKDGNAIVLNLPLNA